MCCSGVGSLWFFGGQVGFQRNSASVELVRNLELLSSESEPKTVL